MHAAMQTGRVNCVRCGWWFCEEMQRRRTHQLILAAGRRIGTTTTTTTTMPTLAQRLERVWSAQRRDWCPRRACGDRFCCCRHQQSQILC
jgi:hypothetical protein